MTEAAASPADVLLPALRQDLVLHQGETPANGDPSWRLYDPLRHRYVMIDRSTAIILALWPGVKATRELAALAERRLGRAVSISEIDQLVQFLQQNGLLETVPGEQWRRSLVPPPPGGSNLVMRAVHSYLFFKIPLFAPERFLNATAHLATPLFSRTAVLSFALIGLLGLYLVAQEWNAFIDEARKMMIVSGLAQFGATLFLVKILHEFAHAYAAHHVKCRVPVMGVAVMMGAPLLYTDVTDAWRITDRHQRFLIDVAGVTAELFIACVATFAWVFLPDGAPRHFAFLLATTSWITSVVINLNPLMRFDGYHILSDLIGIENLQQRSFDMASWQLRELLFGIDAPPPEQATRRRMWFLAVFGWAVWVYRLLLFTGIALAVYTFFFKALGVVLFLFEIAYFIVKPIAGEVKVWWTMRSQIAARARTRATAAAVAILLLLVFAPWSQHVAVPAVLDAELTSSLHASRAARVQAVHVSPGMLVKQGTPIAELSAPDLEQELQVVQFRLRAVKLRLDRSLVDQEDRNERIVLESTRDALVARIDGLQREFAELTLVAPFDGVVAEVNAQLKAGRWLGVKEQVAVVRAERGGVVRGFVPDTDAWRIDRGARAVFVPEAANARRLAMTVTSVSVVAATFIDSPELTVQHGGQIDAPLDERKRAKPTRAHFTVIATPDETDIEIDIRQRGTMHVTGFPESFATAMVRRVLRVLVRESGT